MSESRKSSTSRDEVQKPEARFKENAEDDEEDEKDSLFSEQEERKYRCR